LWLAASKISNCQLTEERIGEAASKISNCQLTEERIGEQYAFYSLMHHTI